MGVGNWGIVCVCEWIWYRYSTQEQWLRKWREGERVNLLCGFPSIRFKCAQSVQRFPRDFHAVTKDPCETSLFTLQ